MPDPQKPNENEDFDPTTVDPNAPIDPAAQTTDPAKPADPAAGTDEEELFEDEVDLGNGEKLTFTGKTPEEVREKVFAAIKDLHSKSKSVQTSAPATPSPATPATPAAPAAPKAKDLTEDQAFAVNHEFKNGSPIKALDDYFRNRFEVSVADVVAAAQRGKSAADNSDRFQREAQAVEKFMSDTPDYDPTPSNRIAMELHLRASGQEASPETLKKAFNELTAAGLIKKAEAAAPATPSTPATPTPAAPSTAAPRKPQASAMWGRTGGPRRQAPAKQGPTDAEIQKKFNEGGSEALLEMLSSGYQPPTA